MPKYKFSVYENDGKLVTEKTECLMSGQSNSQVEMFWALHNYLIGWDYDETDVVISIGQLEG